MSSYTGKAKSLKLTKMNFSANLSHYNSLSLYSKQESLKSCCLYYFPHLKQQSSCNI